MSLSKKVFLGPILVYARTINDVRFVGHHENCIRVTQRKVFTTPLLTEAKSDRNAKQFTKKKSRCQKAVFTAALEQNNSPSLNS